MEERPSVYVSELSRRGLARRRARIRRRSQLGRGSRSCSPPPPRSAPRWPSASPVNAGLITRSPPVRRGHPGDLRVRAGPCGRRTRPCTIPQVAAGALAVAGARMEPPCFAPGATTPGRPDARVAPARPAGGTNRRQPCGIRGLRRPWQSAAAARMPASRGARWRASPGRPPQSRGGLRGVRISRSAVGEYMHRKPASCALRRPGRVSHLTCPPTSRPPPSCTEDSKGIMELSRRDLIKVGLFSSAALTAAGRARRPYEARRRESSAAEQAARAVHAPLEDAARGAQDDDRRGRLLTITQQQTKVNILPDRQTTIWGYNGDTPGPTIKVDQGRRRSCATSRAARAPPDARLRPCGRRCTFTARLAAPVRRLRQRHHPPRRVQGLPLPELPGRADALVPRPRRPPHRRERVHGPRGAVPPARPGRAGAADPARPVRPAVHPQGRHVPGQRLPGHRRQQTRTASTATSSSSTACRGRRWRSSRASTASACSMPASRAPSTSRSTPVSR